MPKYKTYKPYLRFEEVHNCDWLGLFPKEPYYGEVSVTEAWPGIYAYACEGHIDTVDSLPYKEEENGTMQSMS